MVRIVGNYSKEVGVVEVSFITYQVYEIPNDIQVGDLTLQLFNNFSDLHLCIIFLLQRNVVLSLGYSGRWLE